MASAILQEPCPDCHADLQTVSLTVTFQIHHSLLLRVPAPGSRSRMVAVSSGLFVRGLPPASGAAQCQQHSAVAVPTPFTAPRHVGHSARRQPCCVPWNLCLLSVPWRLASCPSDAGLSLQKCPSLITPEAGLLHWSTYLGVGGALQVCQEISVLPTVG